MATLRDRKDYKKLLSRDASFQLESTPCNRCTFAEKERGRLFVAGDRRRPPQQSKMLETQ